MPTRIVKAATLARHGSPPLTRSPVSTCCSPYPGGPVQVHLSAASPDRAAFPVLRPGRHPRLPFRGLLRLYTRYGPSIRSTARSGLCRGASIRPVTQPHRPPATGPTDHCPGGTSTHKVIAPFGDAPEITESHRVPPRSYALRAERHFPSRWLSVALNLGDLRVEPCFAARAPLRGLQHHRRSGQDVSATGKAVTNTAEKVKQGL